MTLSEKNALQYAIIFVLTAHLILLVYFYSYEAPFVSIKNKNKLRVQTVRFVDKALEGKVKNVEAVQKISEVPKNVEAVQQISEVPKITPKVSKKKSEQKKIILPQKTAVISEPKKRDKPDQKQQLIAKARESLAKIEKIEKKDLNSEIPALQTISLHSSEGAFSELIHEKETAYRSALAEHLKFLLTLPEKGSLNVRLTLKKDGEVVKIEVLSSESAKNQSYLEKTLPKHKMPPFDKSLGNKEMYTFTIMMKGE